MAIDAVNRPEPSDILFFSHLRWNFVFQRPQHVATRWTSSQRAWFWEEPHYDASTPRLEVIEHERVTVLVPHLRPGEVDPDATLRTMLDGFLRHADVQHPIGWYWTPMMRSFSSHVRFSTVVWDCMDELGNFAFAPPELRRREQEMLEAAHVVFTGGHQIYEAKRHRHPNIYPMPSSVDFAHFAKARRNLPEPADQAPVPGPRIGWFGVIDERTDLPLLDGVARARPDWHLVMVGPVVKISPDVLPRHPNLHWLGMKDYKELPSYVAGWDVAMLPFARNDATRYISPTKTPEYLAAGKPVVSTSIADVVRPYGERDLVRIADTVPEFVAAIEAALTEDPTERRAAADAFLATTSWDATVTRMQQLVARAHVANPSFAVAK
jgi:glycosyltransferase involved in cell wall biosynthesis